MQSEEEKKEKKRLAQIIYRKNNKDKIKESNKQYRNKNKDNKKESNKNYRNVNINIIKEYGKLYRENNKDKTKIYYNANKDKIKETHKIYTNKNKVKIKENQKRYYLENKRKIYNINKKWRENNVDLVKFYKKKYKANKFQNDPLFNLNNNIGSLIRDSFRYKGFKKSSKTLIILGCSIEEFKQHLESKFETWMNWENKGNPKDGILELNKTWDIDHIIPVSSAKTEEDIIKLNHYSNLQPLCSYTNRFIKRNKI